MTEPFRPPPYPYDRLGDLHAAASAFAGGAVDLSIGTPGDPPPELVREAMLEADPRGYPPSIGTLAFREAAAAWYERRLGVTVGADDVRACVGSKELVAGLPHWLRLRDPGRDTVLYPAVSYPSYAMGARLAGCRAVPVALDARWSIDLTSIEPSDAERALCLWVNTPGNPAGGLDDLAAVAEWGRATGVPVVSDECYVEFTWDGPPRTILASGLDGVLAVHSLSKRSNLAGARAAFYVGDAELVEYLGEVRKHAGFMSPHPVQAAAAAALGDDVHVDAQRDRYAARLDRGLAQLASLGVDASPPRGGFYLWARSPTSDGWELARRLATEVGVVVSPGEFYGSSATAYVRLAMVAPDEALDLVDERIAAAD